MLRIAICDDEPQYVRQITNFVQEYLNTHPELPGQIDSFSQGRELLYQAEERGGFDL